jgi:hypothetical protein
MATLDGDALAASKVMADAPKGVNPILSRILWRTTRMFHFRNAPQLDLVHPLSAARFARIGLRPLAKIVARRKYGVIMSRVVSKKADEVGKSSEAL